MDRVLIGNMQISPEQAMNVSIVGIAGLTLIAIMSIYSASKRR